MNTSRVLVDDVVREINAERDQQWTVTGALDGGWQSGAWKLRAVDGSLAVLKLATTPDWARQVVRAAEAVTVVRRAAYPTPEWQAVGITGAGIGYEIHEFVAGTTLDIIDLRRADLLISVLETQKGLDPDPGRCWTDYVFTLVTTGFPRLRREAEEAGAGPELLERCDLLVRDAGGTTWPRGDMVHGDFRPGNVLFEGELVTGVIDIEAIGSGPRAFDYATLLSHDDIEPDAVERIVEACARSAAPAVVRSCVAATFLDLVRFMARHPNPSEGGQATRIHRLGERAETIHRLTS